MVVYIGWAARFFGRVAVGESNVGILVAEMVAEIVLKCVKLLALFAVTAIVIRFKFRNQLHVSFVEKKKMPCVLNWKENQLL